MKFHNCHHENVGWAVSKSISILCPTLNIGCLILWPIWPWTLEAFVPNGLSTEKQILCLFSWSTCVNLHLSLRKMLLPNQSGRRISKKTLWKWISWIFTTFREKKSNILSKMQLFTIFNLQHWENSWYSSNNI